MLFRSAQRGLVAQSRCSTCSGVRAVVSVAGSMVVIRNSSVSRWSWPQLSSLSVVQSEARSDQDLRFLTYPRTCRILRHRLIPNFAAQSEGVTSDDITRMILEKIPKDE